MGPYCKFCNQRCFTHMPAHTPPEILAAYGSSTIIATCPAGQQFERDKVGYCYDDIQREQRRSAEEDRINELEMWGPAGRPKGVL